MIDYLLKLSQNDIPFTQAHLIIHQPTLKELGYIGGEETLFFCYKIINFSKSQIEIQDKNYLQNKTDFEILMILINNKQGGILSQKGRVCLKAMLTLLFPDFIINFLPASILLSKEKDTFFIDKDNFNIFKDIFNEMFCFSDIIGTVSQKYNPGGPQGRALAQKFRKRQEKLAKIKNHNQQHRGIEILANYISILAIGKKQDINTILNYTVPQLIDEMQRFKLKEEFETYKQLKLAGAKDVEQVKNWMANLHFEDD